MTMRVPLSSPDITEVEIEGVTAVLRTNSLSLGPKLEEFEQAFASFHAMPHAIAVSSGTAALHLAIRALNLGPGDEVIVPSFTFIAVANAVVYERATPIFVDIDPISLNIDPDCVEAAVTPRTRAIIVVHTFGVAADMDALLALAQRHNLAIIEDACEAIGATYNRQLAGTFGHISVFAFYPNKQITTGEGGMIVTSDDRLAEFCRSCANQGRGAMGAWLQHDRLGHNYRMDELSAALGLSQLARLDHFIARRARVARQYGERLAAMDGVRAPAVRPEVRMSWFVYVVTLDEGCDRDRTIAGMEREGVPARGYFAPIHTQPYIRERFGDLAGTLPLTEAMARRTLALPFHNDLQESEIERVLAVLRRNLR